MTTTGDRERFGVLTDAALRRSRLRLGVPQPQRNPPHNYEVTWDGVRHFAYGYGDDNPLFTDPEYAAISTGPLRTLFPIFPGSRKRRGLTSCHGR